MHVNLQNGYLKIPGHYGEFPPYQLENRWGLTRRFPLDDNNISFEVKGNKLSISTEDLLRKLKLNTAQIGTIRNERNLATRSVILENFVKFNNAVEKGDRGNLLLSFFVSPMQKQLRQDDPQRWLQSMEEVFIQGPISLESLIKSFTYLCQEEFSPYFFVLGEKILEKISTEDDKSLLKNTLDRVLSILESLPAESPLVQDPRFLNMLARIRDTRSVTVCDIERRTLQEKSSAPMQRTRLRWMGNEHAIYEYLKLGSWQTLGDKTVACRRIVSCFKHCSPVLDLSDLQLTSLPSALKELPWIQELNLSKNTIADLTPLSHLKRLEVLDLSFNLMGGRGGIADFQALNQLEMLRSVKLLCMRGNPRILEDRLRQDLKNCDRIEWMDEWATHRTFSRRERELLGDFWRRRDQEFRALAEDFAQLSLTRNGAVSVLDNPKDPTVLAKHSEALERLGLSDLDITPLLEKDPNIRSWLHRLAIEETGIKGFRKDPQVLAVLSQKVPEILRYALENEEFFEKVLRHLLYQSSIHCSDRTVYYFNEIVRRMELFQAKDLSLREALHVFRKYFPVALIKKAAQQSLQERTQGVSLEEKEELDKESLEIELDFLIRFKEKFQGEFAVPLPLDRGNFVGTGREEREEFLQRATENIRQALQSSESWIQYLAEDPEWRLYLIRHLPGFQSSLQREEESFRIAEIDKLESEGLDSEEYNKRYLELQRGDRENSSSFLARMTRQILKEHGFLDSEATDISGQPLSEEILDLEALCDLH